ncbi:MAG: 4Fe-4S binding protein, partial [Clostridiales bacterium]|nr:4Fe-4S binding protein [Clostridiales bacterium]
MGAFKFAKTVMNSLFKKPATLMYPVVPRQWQERTRGAIDIDKEVCILCGICSRKCPTNAITVDRKEGYWEIQRMQCIQCGECVAECPKDCLVMNPKYTEPNPEKIIDTVDVEVKKPAPKKDVKADDKVEAKADD